MLVAEAQAEAAAASTTPFARAVAPPAHTVATAGPLSQVPIAPNPQVIAMDLGDHEIEIIPPLNTSTRNDDAL